MGRHTDCFPGGLRLQLLQENCGPSGNWRKQLQNSKSCLFKARTSLFHGKLKIESVMTEETRTADREACISGLQETVVTETESLRAKETALSDSWVLSITAAMHLNFS